MKETREEKKKNIRKKVSKSSLDRLRLVSSLPEAGSNGRRPARRRGVPAGRSGSRSRPPFFTATGGTGRLASSPGPSSASGQPGLPLPPSLPRHYPPYTLLPGYDPQPPRYQPHSPTSWPRPCRRISPPARPGGLAAAAALGPPWPLPWWLPGWVLCAPQRERKGGAGTGASKRADGASREPERSRRRLTVGDPRARLSRRPRLPGDGWRLALTDGGKAGEPRAGCVPSVRGVCAARASPPGSEPRAAAAACACALGRQRGGGAEGTAGEGRGRCSPAFYF